MDADIVVNINGFLKIIASYSSYILATVTIIYLAVKIVNDLKNGLQIDFFIWFKPLAVTVLLLFYTTFFTLLSEVFYITPAKLTQKLVVDVDGGFQQSELAGRLGISDMDDSNSDILEKQVKQVILFLTKTVKNIIGFIIEILQKIILSLLFIIGPLCIALGLMPGISSIRAWLIQIITVSLWVPVMNIVRAIVISFISYITNTGSGDYASHFIFHLATDMIVILTYAKVPSLIASIIPSKQSVGGFLGLSALYSSLSLTKKVILNASSSTTQIGSETMRKPSSKSRRA